MNSTRQKVIAFAAAVLLFTSLSAEAQSRRQNKDKTEEEAAPISILDSTEAQWGMRSVNDSVYQGYPMNAVYLERGRSKLPANFPKYTPKPLGDEVIVRSSGNPTTTIRVNGVETPLEVKD